jgi:hypothetical protein
VRPFWRYDAQETVQAQIEGQRWKTCQGPPGS